MQTEHFNMLTEAEQERLSILIEECGEVIQAACKILRHGYDSNNKGAMSENNREALERELGDLLHASRRMFAGGDIDVAAVEACASSKLERLRLFLHHQIG